METTSLILAILIPSIIVSFFIACTVISFYLTKVKITNNESGTLIYMVDVKNRSYKMASTSFNQKPYFKRDKFTGWKYLDELNSSLFAKPEAKRSVREVLQKLDNGSKYEVLKIKYHPNKNKYVIFTLTFIQNDDDEYYIAKEQWKTYKIKDDISEDTYTFLKKNEAVEMRGQYKGFVAFNLNPWESRADHKIIDIANSFTTKLNYFISSGMLIFVFGHRSKEATIKELKRFIKKFKQNETKHLGGRFYNGSAVAYTRNITGIKTMNKMVSTLSFLVDKSIETSEDFVSHADKLIKSDFETFAIASKLLRNAIKTGSITFSTRAVRYWRTNKKITNYVFPEIKGINKTMIYRLTRNANSRNELMDKITHMIGVEGESDKHILVDVRADWLIKNGHLLKYKKAIYVINYNQNSQTDELNKMVLKLKREGFIFAIKVRKFNKNVLSMLKMLDPDFIVVSKFMKNDDNMYTSETLINLMTINKLSKAKKIKMIYDDPPNVLDKVTCEKIGLKFYYK